MKPTFRIDFVSDVSCPWCVVGLRSLEQALVTLGDEVAVDIHLQPFELNPRMPKEGQNLDEHLQQKYGGTPAQFAPTRDALKQRGAALGFDFRMDKRDRIYNTFDAHRLLHWAEGFDKAVALKHALFAAYFTAGQAPSDLEVLVNAAASVGLDASAARALLESDALSDEVREQEKRFLDAGIHAVPAVIIDGKFLIEGGQSPETYAQVLRQIAAKATENAAHSA